jgi:hypothetical protein
LKSDLLQIQDERRKDSVLLHEDRHCDKDNLMGMDKDYHELQAKILALELKIVLMQN